jgi:drug/metabolite transporter (DMT)-like permease
MIPATHVLAGMGIADYQGELAALGTACCWTVSALAFAVAAKRLGSLTLNIIRLAMAMVFFAAFNGAVRGLPLPTDAGAHQWFWLGLSGLVGFTFGDLCLFRALVVIGPRLATLMLCLVPVLAAVISWIALGEALSVYAMVGMVLTLGGVVWVVLERRPLNAGPAPSGGGPPLPAGAPGQRISVGGALLALGAAVGQAVGLVLSKVGMAGYDAFAATQIRTAAGLAGFAVLFFVLRAWARLGPAVRDRAGMGYASLGAFFGPFLGVSLSLVAVKYTYVGVAATIIAIVPILIIPFVILLHRERVSSRAVFGAVLAVAGVALLFW